MTDSSNTATMQRTMSGRVWRIGVLISLLFGLYVYRLYSFQLLQHNQFRALSQSNYERTIRVPALRGRIFDREGRLLADNTPISDLAFTRVGVSRKEFARCLETAAPIVSIPTEELWKIWKNTPVDRFGYKVLVPRLTPEQIVTLEERKESLPGSQILVRPRRWTINGEIGAHILGYTGEVSQAEYEKRKSEGVCPGDEVGKAGLEKVFESRLRGKDGEKSVRVFSNELVHSEVYSDSVEPIPGQDLHLTIDWELETAAQEILGASVGTLIAIDPRNGDVLALANYPTYDPNLFSRRDKSVSRIVTEKIDGVGRMVNIGLQSYPPGSVLKIPYSLMALDRGDIDVGTVIDCPGQYSIPGNTTQTWDCWIYGTNGVGHGPMTVVGALQHSCDCFFYELGRRIGVNRMDEYTQLFGFGELTGIDLPNEKKGIRPSREGKIEALRRFGGTGSNWYSGDTINASIGQGIVMATPLQVAMMTAMVANGGTLWKPRLVKDTVGRDGITESYPAQPRTPQRTWKKNAFTAVDEGLFRVVQERGGTAYSQRIPGIEVCGKTGTAQSAPGKPSHAWFVCYAPRRNPELAVVVFLPMGGHGGSVATPLAREFLLRYFDHSRQKTVQASNVEMPN